jgi:hypothetical protein
MSFPSWLRALRAHVAQGTVGRSRRGVATRRNSRRPNVERLEDRTVPTTFTVTNTLDSGPGSFRQAILDANATPNVGGPDRIEFDIGSAYQNADGSATIQPLTQLPSLTDPVVIDGYTQAGASPNTLPQGENAVLKIELSLYSVNMFDFRSTDGINIMANNCVVRGLILNNAWGYGVAVYYGSNNQIEGNFIGTDVTGTKAVGVWNGARNFAGVVIENASVVGASTIGNTIGGDTPDARNIIADNEYGLVDMGLDTVVSGNWIGLGSNGLPVPNDIGLADHAPDSSFSRNLIVAGGGGLLVGGLDPGARNVVSGNASAGILASSCTIQGNYIGTDPTGTLGFGNGTSSYANFDNSPGAGIYVVGSSTHCLIGGDVPGARNVISTNFVGVFAESANSAVVEGNYIGTDYTGTQAIAVGGGAYTGVQGVSLVGGNANEDRNIIAGISGYGVVDCGVVTGNWIGIGADGSPLINDGDIQAESYGLVYDGSPHAARIGDTAVLGLSAGGSLVVTYNGATTVPANAGTYDVVATFTSSEPNNIFAEGLCTVQIDPAAPFISVTSETYNYDGDAHPATARAIGVSGEVVSGTFSTLTYNGSSTAPVDPGKYYVVATFTSSDPNYINSTGTGRIIIKPATPQTLTVTLSGDDANQVGTLRNAVATAVDGDTIQIDTDAVTTPILLNNGELLLDQDVTIETSGSTPATISGEGSTRVFEIAGGANVTLVNLNIVDGFVFQLGGGQIGGGILNDGTAVLNGCTVSGNVAVGYPAPVPFEIDFGGGIANRGTMVLNNCTVSGNQAGNPIGVGENSGDGGGIANFGTLTLINSAVTGNTAAIDDLSYGLPDQFYGVIGGEDPDIFNAGTITPPVTAHISSAATGGTPDRVILTLTASDLSAADQQAGFIYRIDWGDGTDTEVIPQSLGNGAGLVVTHDYAADGVYSVSVTAQDNDGNMSAQATAWVGLSTSPQDLIEVFDNRVFVSGSGFLGAASPTDLIFVSGQGGGDTYTVDFGQGLTVPVTIAGGGAGSDDTLIVYGDYSDTNYITKTPGQITWGDPVTETVYYSGIPNTVINANGTSENYINDPGGSTVINGGTGANTIVVSATTGTGVVINGGPSTNDYVIDLGSLAGPVTINNSNATAEDSVAVNGAAGNNAITVSGNQVTGGGGAESITMNVVAPLAGLTVNGGLADNTYTIDLGSLPGPVTINNGNTTSNDSVVVHGAAGDNAIAVAGNQVTAGDQSITLAVTAPLSSLTVDVSNTSGTNEVSVASLTVPVESVAVDAGANDSVAVSPSVTVPVIVTGLNRPPTAVVGGPYVMSYGSNLLLDASGSSDPDNDALTYSWTINGTAGVASGVQPSLSYSQLQAIGIVVGQSFAVSVQVDDGHGHVVDSAETTLTVIQATPTIVVAGGPYSFDRLAHAATVTAVGADGASVSGSFVVTYNGSTKVPKKIGTYIVAVTFASSDGNYTNATGIGSITINPATPTIAITGGPFTFDGDSHSAKVRVTGLRGGEVQGSITVTYDGSSVAPTNAGTYVVVVSFTSNNPRYADAVATGSITIDPAAAKVKFSGGAVTYDGQAHAATVAVLGVRPDSGSSDGSDDDSDTGRPLVSGSMTITYNGSANAPVNAGTYVVVVTFTSSDPNYSSATATGSLTINQAKVTVRVDHDLMLVGNNPPSFTGTITGVIAGDNVVAIYATTATSQSAVGIYPIGATLSGTSAANYLLQVNAGNLYVVSIGADPNLSGGHAISFWDNAGNSVKVTASDLKALDKLDLLNNSGSNFDPTQASQLQAWLQSASATNVAYWLSAQLAAMELNVLSGYVKTSDIVYAGQLVQYNTLTNPIVGLDSGGFITIGNLMAAANAALGTGGLAASGSFWQAYELALAQALATANVDTSFLLQSVPGGT